MTLPKGVEPFALRSAFGDHTTSLAAAAGICAALVEAARTGQGRLVEASLFRTGIFAAGSDLAIQLFFGRLASNKSRTEQIVPMMNFYKSKDERWICIVARQGEVDWKPLCRALGLTDFADDERFNSAKARRANQREAIALLDEGFGKFTREELASRLDAESIAWAPVQTAAEVAEDPQAHAAGAIVRVPSQKGDGSTFAAPASPVRFPGAHDGPKGPSPRMGEHARDILRSLGESDAAIDDLFAQKVVL
jgi:crotonobetainyl-CoA:carnitine CoA-transferase CaiB-like acyl-CoA transferase